jgi:hypothetical protein
MNDSRLELDAVPVKRHKEHAATQTIVSKYSDDLPLTVKQVAEAMNLHRSTIHGFKAKGYKMEFGRMTTLGHLKAWLRESADRFQTKPRGPKHGRTP